MHASANMQAYGNEKECSESGNVVIDNVKKKGIGDIGIESEIISFTIWQARERNSSDCR